MNSLITLPVSRTPQLVERSLPFTTPESNRTESRPAADASRPQGAMGRFLAALLRSLSTPTV